MSTGYLERVYGLSGRTAVVTGARTGIGRACAVALAGAGADVVLWGRSDGGMEDVAGEVRSFGVTARVVGGEMSDLDAVAAVADRVLDGTRVDILVNNAGMIARGPAAGVALQTWRDVLTVNLDAVFLLSQRFGVPMTERGHGAIVNIASLLSFQGGLNVAAYTASKHAVTGLTKSLANEWASLGVNVNAVAPGYVVTNNTEALRADPDREPSIRSRIPAGHWAEPEDIAGAVAFLASPAARYVHGHTLVVDGGWMGR
jgi:2-dehydro-3-deoxy-D-gluconate 5-dehydrogenase